MKKIIISASTIIAVAAIIIGATGAFFSDTETSTGNTFTAGAIDLKIDNESYYNGVLNEGTTWLEPSDLDGQLFFNFDDLKPGDWGEDTISIHVDSNDSWVCAQVDLTKNDDMSSTEPELADGDVQDDPQDMWDGELAQELNFIFWVDDGDNVLEVEETVITQGPASNVLDGGVLAIADSSLESALGGDPMTGGETFYIGKAWCYGDLGIDPVAQGDNDPTQASGVTCDGSAVTNISQTDSVMGDIIFYAEQSRNNEEFICEAIDVPEPRREISGTNGEGWPTSTQVKDWIAKGRYGDNNPSAGSYEMEVGTGPGDRSEDNKAWADAQVESWTLVYDQGAGTATLTIGGDVSTHTVAAPDSDSYISVIAKTHNDNDDGTTVEITNVKLDGMAPAGSDNVSAETTGGVREINSLDITGDLELTDGFTLSGDIMFDWGTNPRDEGPAMEIVIGQSS